MNEETLLKKITSFYIDNYKELSKLEKEVFINIMDLASRPVITCSNNSKLKELDEQRQELLEQIFKLKYMKKCFNCGKDHDQEYADCSYECYCLRKGIEYNEPEPTLEDELYAIEIEDKFYG